MRANEKEHKPDFVFTFLLRRLLCQVLPKKELKKKKKRGTRGSPFTFEKKNILRESLPMYEIHLVSHFFQLVTLPRKFSHSELFNYKGKGKGHESEREGGCLPKICIRSYK
jgi:hypothetical protein